MASWFTKLFCCHGNQRRLKSCKLLAAEVFSFGHLCTSEIIVYMCTQYCLFIECVHCGFSVSLSVSLLQQPKFGKFGWHFHTHKPGRQQPCTVLSALRQKNQI